MLRDKPVFAAINTIKAKPFEILCARLFGKKIVSTDDSLHDNKCTITIYCWRGKSYLTKCEYDKKES